jgi:predicted lipoprotein with Yx(FWY)xxD motif
VFRMRTILTIAALALGLAACANNSSSSAGAGGVYGGGGATSVPAAASGTAAIQAAKVPGVGTVLTNSDGMTLYLFEADTGTTSTCSGDCATNWPPVTTSGNATATMGATSSMLGTTTRDDGSTQVTYNGHPLYTFVGDTSSGQATGQGINAFGGLWYVVNTAGDAVTGGSSSGGNGGGNGGSGGNSGYGNGGYG